MKNIALLYICTGAYTVFWDEFYRTFEENFLPGDSKDYFVFTDADHINCEEENSRIHRIYQENLGWPGNTLFRFRMFRSIEDRLKEFDYIFFINANIICQRPVTEEEFLPDPKDLLVVQHPGPYARKPYQFTYDRNRHSRAYVPYYKGKYYVCGGVNGGKSEAYLNLIRELEHRVDEDYEKGIIALWHDESHLNRYIIDYPDSYRMLSPSFCYSEEKNIPFEPVFFVRDKKKYITYDPAKTAELKYRAPFLSRAWRVIQYKFWKNYYNIFRRRL